MFSAQRSGMDAPGAMVQGLLCSLLIGTVIKTLGRQLGLALAAIILPAVLTLLLNLACCRLGWVRGGELKLQ